MEMDMYHDIATGNPWGWLPGEGCPSTPAYARFIDWTLRCRSYTARVESGIYPLYKRWSEYLGGFYPSNPVEYLRLYDAVREYAEGRVEKLRDYLRGTF